MEKILPGIFCVNNNNNNNNNTDEMNVLFKNILQSYGFNVCNNFKIIEF